MFAFCPINPDGTDKKIHETSGIVTNMTMLGVHFMISSNGRNPFKKQKQWGKAKKDKGEFRDPIIYFLLAIATETSSLESFMSGNAAAVFYYGSRNSNPLIVTPS